MVNEFVTILRKSRTPASKTSLSPLENVRLSESHPENDPSPSFAEQMVFDSNLQEFASRVGLIVGLELGEKISSEEAYQRIRALWKQLKQSKKNLHIGKGGDSDHNIS